MKLHNAILQANIAAVSDALARNPNHVNLLDSAHRTALFCAIVGPDLKKPNPPNQDRNAILALLLSRSELSLYALNAPMDCAKGSTPLSLAAYSGNIDQVLTLLDCPSVLVDACDASGMSPLMHAVRGRNIQIASVLLCRGARADLLDSRSRSVLEFAKNQQELLLLLEAQLRTDRRQKSATSSQSSFSPPPTVYSLQLDSTPVPTSDTLFQDILRAIISEDLSALYTILNAVTGTASRSSLRKIAINSVDEYGLAPIHRALMCHPPRLEIIEMLFQAGADINLPTLSGKSPLMVFVENASPNKFPDLHHHLVFYLVKDLRASLFYKDSQLETVLHVAAERGHCPRTLAALLSCDTGKVLYEMKNKRLLRPIDVARPELLPVFQEDVRPDSVCTLRPKASVSSFSSITSQSTIVVTPRSNSGNPEVTHEEAETGSRLLLDEIEFSLLQRTLFYRSSLDGNPKSPSQYEPPTELDESLNRASLIVIGYWRSCLARAREQLETAQKSVVKTHLLIARTKREVERRTGDGDQEVSAALRAWEAEQAMQPFRHRDQARGRAFTAPSNSSNHDEALSHALQAARKGSLSSPNSDRGVNPDMSTWLTTTTEKAQKRSSRVATYIKQKLRPTSRRSQTPGRPRENSNASTATVFDIMLEDEGATDTDRSHALLRQRSKPSLSAPTSPVHFTTVKHRPWTADSRGSSKQSTVVLARAHGDLVRIEDYVRGIRSLAVHLDEDIENARLLIDNCLARSLRAEEKPYEDEKLLELLRAVLLVGLERKVDEICSALDVVRKWNGLVKTLLRDYRQRIAVTQNLYEDGEEED